MTSARGVVLVLLAAQASACAGRRTTQNPNAIVVRGVSFKGNHAIDGRTLKISIASTGYSRPFPLSLFGKGTAPVFNEREFRRDVLRIKALYGVRGFPDARV